VAAEVERPPRPERTGSSARFGVRCHGPPVEVFRRGASPRRAGGRGVAPGSPNAGGRCRAAICTGADAADFGRRRSCHGRGRTMPRRRCAGAGFGLDRHTDCGCGPRPRGQVELQRGARVAPDGLHVPQRTQVRFARKGRSRRQGR
jgi:hypothetical protein